MAGGTWTAQNKVRPGIYINFESRGTPVSALGTRGTVAIPKALFWGPVGQVVTVEAGADTTPAIGYALTDPQALFLREMFKGTNVTSGPVNVLLYRLPAQGAVPATAEISAGVTATAVFHGIRGNDIAVTVAADVDDPSLFNVTTLVGGRQVAVQQARTVAELKANGWVAFSGPGPLAATAGVSLVGGADGTVDASAYAAALEALESYSFDILAYDGTDSTVQAAYISFVKRLSEQRGRYTQLVASGVKNADSRFVINTEDGVILEDGTQLAAAEVMWWLAGAEAGAQYYASLTYANYPGAVDTAAKQTDSQIQAGILAGNIVLSEEDGSVHLETDINTLTSYTPDIGKVFHKNLTMRVCNTLANDIYREFHKNWIGKVKNNPDGRSAFKSVILDMLLAMYKKEALSARPLSDDVSVERGDESDSIVIVVAIAIGDSVEKIYMTITVS